MARRSALGDRSLIIAGALLFNFFALLDCVDGNIARVKKQESLWGSFVDALGGYVAFACVLPAAGIAAENLKQVNIPMIDSFNFIVIGMIAAVSNLTMRLIYQHFCNVSSKGKMEPGSFQKSFSLRGQEGSTREASPLNS